MTFKIGRCAAFFLFLSACASSQDKMPEMSAEELYRKGYDLFQEKEYVEACKYFDEVERQHPYSVWSGRAQIMSAYAFYKKGEYDEAVLVLDRFIQLHPGNRNTPYAYYLKALCYYEQISDVKRDQKMTEMALLSFEELLARFPKSIYEADAAHKLKLIENYLAGKEMAVGRYYQKTEDVLAAMNRFQSVVQTYPQTAQLPEALYRLAVCYRLLGLTEKSAGVVGILEKKFPQSEWTALAQKLSREGA